MCFSELLCKNLSRKEAKTSDLKTLFSSVSKLLLDALYVLSLTIFLLRWHHILFSKISVMSKSPESLKK